MSPAEFRYGNYVQLKDRRNEYFRETYSIQDIFGLSGLYTLKEVSPSAFIKHRYPGIYIEPILLTPRILELAGFEKEEENSELLCQGYQRYYMTVFLNKNNGDLEWIEYGNNSIFYPKNDDKFYLHQLQNLYFAIVEEEIIIENFNILGEKKNLQLLKTTLNYLRGCILNRMVRILQL